LGRLTPPTGPAPRPFAAADLEGLPAPVRRYLRAVLRDGQRPVAAAVLNLTPDHLARHGDMAGYAAAKLRLLSRMQPDGLALLPAGDPHLRAEAIPGGLSAGARLHLLGGAPGVRVDGGAAWLTGGRDDGPVDLSALPVPGRHNLDNAAVAIALDEAARSGRFQIGDPILLVVFGGGLTYASAVIEW
jgi:UDP-N-acetylmuramoylalanine-D-glutamate ligase